MRRKGWIGQALRLVWVGFGLAGWGCTGAGTPVDPPLLRAHAHNDYEHSRPLLDALEQGFCSVEADVYAVDGELLVAHNRKDCRPGRTVDSLYLQPLIARAKTGQGHVLPGLTQPFTLLVDIKADGEEAYRLLEAKLAASAGTFTEFDRGVVYPRAVTVIISGDTPRGTMAEEARRFAFVDGRGKDLETPVDQSAPTALVPLVSMAWRERMSWEGRDEIGPDERERLVGLVEAAHARGYRIRFWGVPETEAAWRTLYECGVDLINADDLARAAAVLREMGRMEPARGEE